ncbi:MAG: DUF4384 domain-containing protein [Bacteroidales bacterium]|nr:DUF4384 domain-containing protein [Bacteroidales bacterium]
MFRKGILILSAVFVAVASYAQRVQTVSVDYTYVIPENVTYEQAKEIVVQRAKVKAIADNFGMRVGALNMTRMQTVNGESQTDLLSFGESEVRGEWIETIGVPEYRKGVSDDMFFVSVSIRGKIRELHEKRAVADLNIKVLDNPTGNEEVLEFRNGDHLYMSLLSPIDGYVAVYQYDGDKTVFRLLPYVSQTDGKVEVKGKREYLFFHRNDVFEDVQQYTMSTSKEIEYNRLYIIFSKDFFTIPFDSDVYSIPSLDYADFQKWLVKGRSSDAGFFVITKDITIRK